MTAPSLDFELVEELGSGATGSVFRARLRAPGAGLPAGAELAVKFLHAAGERDPAQREAFRREGEVAAALAHPCLVRARASGRCERGPWIAFDHLPGPGLDALLAREGALAEERARSLAADLASALAALHAAGWRHADLKPANARLDAGGRAVLTDLGFLRALAGAGERAGRHPGSLAYQAPEQLAGAEGSAASDLFALGLLLHELATGAHAFLGSDRASAEGLVSLAQARYRPPSLRAPRVSPFLDHLLARVLAADPARRPPASELERLLREGEESEWWRGLLARAAAGDAPRLPAREDPLLPFVGREAELAALAEPWHGRARSGAASAALWLSGASGSGKSRLVAEFALRARVAPLAPTFLSGRCREWEEERPGQPIRSLLRAWLGLPRNTAPGARERALLEGALTPAVAATLALALDPAAEAATDFSVPLALAEWLVQLGKRGPAIVFLDDVTWAGEVTLEVLSRVAEELPRTRLFLVLGLRSDVAPRHAGALEALRERLSAFAPPEPLVLPPLPREAVRELVERLFHRSTPRLRLAEALWRRSRGVPGLLAEILRTLSARGAIAPAPGGSGLQLLVAPEELPFPRSLANALSESYRALSPKLRRWLRRLAVVGGNLEPTFLARAFGADSGELELVLRRFVREGWLVEAGARYRFARPAQRRAVYDAIHPERRRRLHARAARALAPEPGAPTSLSLAFQHAFHLRAAGEHAALLGILPALVRSTLGRGHPQRVHSLTSWGLEALDALGPAPERDALRIELLEHAADAADRLGWREAERDSLERLLESELAEGRDPLSLGRLHLLLGRHAAGTGRYEEARRWLRLAADGLGEAGAAGPESDALRRLALIEAHAGDLTQAVRLAREAEESAPEPLLEGLAALARATTELLEDRLEPALRTCERAMQLLRREKRAGTRAAFASAYLVRARIYRLLGRRARALAAVQRALRLAREAGERRLEVEAGARMGQMLLDVERETEAEERLRDALFSAREIEDRRGEALARTFLGILLAERDDPEGARELERALVLARESGLARLESLALAILARVQLARGELARADELSERALELSQRSGGELADRIVVASTRSLVLERGGRRGAGELVRELERAIRRDNERIAAPIARQRHRRAYQQLLAAALSPDGPVYPRVRLRNLPGE